MISLATCTKIFLVGGLAVILALVILALSILS